jgi:hypothetical protein
MRVFLRILHFTNMNALIQGEKFLLISPGSGEGGWGRLFAKGRKPSKREIPLDLPLRKGENCQVGKFFLILLL